MMGHNIPEDFEIPILKWEVAKTGLMFASKLSQAKKKADSAVTDVILFWLMMGHNIPWDFDTTLLFILMGIRLDNNTHHI